MGEPVTENTAAKVVVSAPGERVKKVVVGEVGHDWSNPFVPVNVRGDFHGGRRELVRHAEIA